MNALRRTGAAVLVVALSAGAVAPLRAQIPGMPLFTNPRYGSGVRVHADFGQATEATVADRVIQGGVSLALGPIGLGAAVGTLKDDLKETQTCIDNPQLGCEDNHVLASALAQLRVAGGGRSKLSLSVFGGASTEFGAADALNCSSLPAAEQPICNALVAQYGPGAKELTIPLGVAVGLRIPLGVASLNLWGAPRYSLTRFVSCQGICPEGDEQFRWAVGADLPIFRVLSVRAAFDSGKIGNETVSFWGVGASIGIGGMR